MIYIGIKYVLSGANEKANLKGTFSKYLIGVALIVMCSTIASVVANIANTDGSNTASGIVSGGFNLGGLKIKSGTDSSNSNSDGSGGAFSDGSGGSDSGAGGSFID